MKIDELNDIYSVIKSEHLYGRYITNEDLIKGFEELPDSWISIVGKSVEKRPIFGLKFGQGKIKVLMWSQMHGNESTTTKALFDCFNFLSQKIELSNHIKESCTFIIIPILNPDGAQRYTRLNANDVDLNRDAQDLSQPESRVLRDTYEAFKPDFCFNLHGQRTIFGAGNSGNVATLSFLSPAQDEARTLTSNRKTAMSIVSAIHNYMGVELPSGIGRYDDSFNINCVGDTFQSFGVPTLLFEAGHYPNDYSREEVRRFVFLALIKGLIEISNGVNGIDYENYFDIPENSKTFYDVIIRNAKVGKHNHKVKDVIFQFKEELVKGRIQFIPRLDSISEQNKFLAHYEIDAHGNLVQTVEKFELHIGYENDFVLINNIKTALKH